MMDRSMVFKGDIIIGSKKQALQEAIKDRTGLVLWTDESKLDKGKVRAGVCWGDTRLGGKTKAVFWGKTKGYLMQSFGQSWEPWVSQEKKHQTP